MFLDTLLNAIANTQSPILVISVGAIVAISFLVFIYRVVNAPFLRMEFRAKEQPEPLYRWLLLYWLPIPIVAALIYYDLIRLFLAALISVAMVAVYILRAVVQFPNRNDYISGYLFWLTRFETSAGEILSNEKASHIQQITQLNRQVAASRNMYAAYRNAAISMTEIVKTAQKGGYFNLQWAVQNVTGIMNDAIRKAEAAEKQLKNMQQQQAYAQPSSYGAYTGNNNKGGKGQQPKSNNGKGGKGQSNKQNAQQPQQAGGYPSWNNQVVQGQAYPVNNNQGSYGQANYGQSNYGQPQQSQQPNNGQQQYFDQAGNPISKNAWKKLQKQGGQGNQGQFDPRGNAHQYRPDFDYVPPVQPIVQPDWNGQSNMQGGGMGNGQYVPMNFAPIQPDFNEWEGQQQPPQPYPYPVYDPNGYPVQPVEPDWIPPQPVWIDEPQRRGFRPS